MSGTAVTGWMLVALLGVMTPGLDTVLVLRHSVLGGRQAGIATMAGITLGCLVWGTATIAGLSALLTASQVGYDVVRIVGAGYLLWLGGSALWHTLPRNRTVSGSSPTAVNGPAVTVGRRAALRAGLVTNLLNPKVGVFYLSLLPQFLPAGSSSATWGFTLVALQLLIAAAWFSSLAWVASLAGRVLLRERVRMWMERVTGTVLIGLGAKLAVEAR